jgi:hypothetical protein
MVIAIGYEVVTPSPSGPVRIEARQLGAGVHALRS